MAIATSMLLLASAWGFYAYGQYHTSTLQPPPPTTPDNAIGSTSDTIVTQYPVRPTIPNDYEYLVEQDNYAADLKNPSNITTEAEYDYETGCYIIRTKLGEKEIATPFMLSADEYNNLVLRQSMQEYYRQKNADLAQEKKDPFNFLDMSFGLGPLEKVFGPGGVQLKTQGSVQLTMGMKINKTDNPAISASARRSSYFDFDEKIQATINASVGNKMKFNMNYNTDATFEFDSQNLKLQYEGEEDEIIKSIEAGNVSMTTGSSLIKGSTALFGVKTTMQFGKLTATALVAQQNSESQTVNTKGGAQTTEFSINADEYDANRHFFLGQFFYDNYDTFCATLPLVNSGINITRIEVWVTNKRQNYDESRNIVAFMDIGENQRLANSHWIADPTLNNPSNTSNNLLTEIRNDYPDARYINQVTTALHPLSAFGIEGGRDYEKVESARLLSSSEYTLNSSLGYISLRSALSSDEVLAVAYEYTYHGTTYQVGEFSGDVTSAEQSLYVKMLKGSTVSPYLPAWKLMMKNVYSLGAYQVQKENFRLNVKYLSDTTGTEISYIPDGAINGTPLIQVLNVDRLDSNNQTSPDGRYDFIEGYTILAATGKVIFPVTEPFGRHLRKKIGNDAIADRYVYQELYDSTQTVAKQLSDKNKFTLSGEYQASSGSQINLNAMNVPQGSVVVTAGGVTLTENSDYIVDYNMGIVTIINQSILDAGTSISVSLENQSTFSTQRKTLLGLDLNYQFTPDFNLGATIMHYSEKPLTEKVAVGNEVVKNTIWGMNFAYKTEFMWLTNLLNKIPTVNATAPSSISMEGEFAQLIPHKANTGSSEGSSYIDDFESTQTGIDLRSPYQWFLASTPYDSSSDALFPEAGLNNNIDYGKNRALLAWYYIDRMFTQRNSSLAPGYIRNDLTQLSNPYVREISYTELYPDRELSYGESSSIQTLNLSFYPNERGPYNLDATNIDSEGNLLYPERRWGGIMRKLDNTNFESSNIEYLQFWLMSPFLDADNPNTDGGDLYFNLGEISEDILKDGYKSYENGLPTDGSNNYMIETVWGRVSSQTSLTYAFDNTSNARVLQDVGLDGLSDEDELAHASYSAFVQELRSKLSPTVIAEMESNAFSPLNDPAGDNYHYYRGYDYDEQELSILERYKRYNGTEGNSLSSEDVNDNMYQSGRSVPDVEDINEDNTLNEYERYFQYRVSLRPEDLVVGSNYITDVRETTVTTRDGNKQEVKWYQFKIPLNNYEKSVGSISDFSTIRFIRMYMTGFKNTTHLRFATLELVRGEWRAYDYSLNTRGDVPAEGTLDVSVVNVEENAGRTPVNYVLPPGVTRIVDPGQSQAVQLNEQSMSLEISDLQAGDARAVYKNTSLDLRTYKRLQMFIHNEALVDDVTGLSDGDVAAFIRLGSDAKNNYYEYEIPLDVTPEGHYSQDGDDRYAVWPDANRLDIDLDIFTSVKKNRNQQKMAGNGNVSYTTEYSEYDDKNNRVSVTGNPSLSNVKVIMIGVRNNSSTTKDCIVWVNELRLTDFDSDGGWAAKGSINLNLSDIATFNFSGHKETVGFGAVDQSLSERNLEDYSQYSIALQVDAGRFLPEKAKLTAPIYFSMTKEKTTPKYNPLDEDVLLKDALDACATEEQRDSIESFAITHSTVKSFSISGLKFDVKSKNPMPWDPANFTLSYSSNRQRNSDPYNEYENTSDYRGSFQYSYAPYFKPFKPFSKIKNKSKNAKFLKDWEFNWLPTSIEFYTNISRYYYEQQERNTTDSDIELPVSVSKNFLWDRQFALNWNITKSLNVSFNSNTTAHIEEPAGAVNKRLFPDKYKLWKDSIKQSIKNLGTPYSYDQSFVATYKAPFSSIPLLNFMTGSVSYNSTYNWERGTEIDGVATGNTIYNQSSWSIDGRINLEQFYNKFKYLRDVNKRFGNSRSNRMPQKPKRFERTVALKADTTVSIRHNLRTKKLKISATSNGKPFAIETRIVDDNNIEILNRGTQNIKLVITENNKEKKNFWKEAAQYATRFGMMVRNVSVRYKNTKSLSLPQFVPEIGDIFGQSNNYDVMAPGLDFAFGFYDENYIYKAKERGWLLADETQTSPALFARTEEFDLEIGLEPIKGLKITLTTNRTDSRTSQIMFMYDNMNTTYSGSYTKTHCAILTAMRKSSADNGYASSTFDKFLENIPVIAERIQSKYNGVKYPTTGFMQNHSLAGKAFDASNGGVNTSSSDVLIPAFMAAYTGQSPDKVTLDPFPGLSAMLPNWRITYDGLGKIEWFRKYFRSLTLTHAYQCTYSVGSFTSYTDWISVDGEMGFSQDELTRNPYPSSPYNISSVAITEKFAPLIGLAATMYNNITLNAEYRDSRTLTLNSAAGQLVEASSKSFVIGGSYKIANFNSILKIGGQQQGVNHDMTINADFTLSNNSALIRKIESNTAQATSGTRTLSINVTADYVLSKRLTVGAYFDHQINTPLVSSTAYPTTNTNFGISINLSLTR